MMINANEIKAFLANNTIAETARIFGVSRQRIQQLVKKYGFTVGKDGRLAHNRKPMPPRPPKPRIITGGVSSHLSTRAVGKVAEMLVAADLLARGWQVFLPLVGNLGHDLVAIREQKIITVEVRPAHRTAAGHIDWARKSGCTSSHYGLVITGEPVHYEPML